MKMTKREALATWRRLPNGAKQAVRRGVYTGFKSTIRMNSFEQKTIKTVKAGKSFKAHKSFARAHVVCRRGWHHRHGRCFRVR